MFITQSGVQFGEDLRFCEDGLSRMEESRGVGHDNYVRLRQFYDHDPNAKKLWLEQRRQIEPSLVSAGEIFRASINMSRLSGPSEGGPVIRQRIDEEHVLVQVPIQHLNMQYDPSGKLGAPGSWRKPSNEKVLREQEHDAIVNRKPIYIVNEASLSPQIRPTLRVVNGNVRVAEAIRSGATHISAHVPAADWRQFRELADKWAGNDES